MKSRQLAGVWIAAASIGALLLYAIWPTSEPSQGSLAEQLSSGWQQSGAANPFSKGATQPERATAAMPNEPVVVLGSLNTSSLQGTQVDGDWGVNAQGQLKASRALRQRFDYFLSLIGEMPLTNIEAALRAAAEKDLKEPALGQVLALWSRYVQLQQHSWKHAVNLREPATWSAALTERQITRRQILGADVAYAFYAEEEAQLQQTLTQVETGQVSQATPINAPALHPQAAEREAAVQAQWQQWEQRLNVARSQIQSFKQAPELSAPQRQQAIEQYLANQFQGTELIRARSLLGV